MERGGQIRRLPQAFRCTLEHTFRIAGGAGSPFDPSEMYNTDLVPAVIHSFDCIAVVHPIASVAPLPQRNDSVDVRVVDCMVIGIRKERFPVTPLTVEERVKSRLKHSGTQSAWKLG
ncbi:hypothetical protein PAXRUDRAFT_824906 [Paxillus rubicundulus Ve08.2h10]|uniref:Uncharacterized protein n=1 Tax=Paxillus rubicundulus Ve08.2h10 TaxID=930991 RepID=A0A0D0E789_9AGAM|nr:hypothetical protein PAXRUDRAFT_824906 [Paxillus rubicundulus Ve08.2h10]